MRQIDLHKKSLYCTYFVTMNDSQGIEEEGFYVDQLEQDDELYSVKVEEMTETLHRHIGVLLCKSKYHPGKLIKGTGLLISPDLVLTCSHNLVTKETLQDNYDFRFYPGHWGKLKTNEGIKVDRVYVPPKYKDKADSVKFQYALLKLSCKIKDTSFIPLRTMVNHKILKKVAIFGYPGKNYNPLNKSCEQFHVIQSGLEKEGAILEINEKIGRIVHCITTYGGQSGAPIIAVDSNCLSVIGIHKGGTYKLNGQDIKANIGRLLTDEVIAELRGKALQWNAEIFSHYGDLFKIERPRVTNLQWMSMESMQNNQVELISLQEMGQLPHRLIGMVNFDNKGRGTGLLLSPNLVLTAAFNVYDAWRKQYRSHMSFVICLSYHQEHVYETYQIEKCYINKEYLNDHTSKYQYALLKLKDRINLKEFIPLKGNVSLNELNQRMAIVGYTHPWKDSTGIWQIGKLGKQTAVEIRNNNEEVVHRLQTVIAMGGGPIMSIDESGGIAVVGIHKGGLQKENQPGKKYKCGRLLTLELIQQLRKEGERLEGDHFLISKT